VSAAARAAAPERHEQGDAKGRTSPFESPTAGTDERDKLVTKGMCDNNIDQIIDKHRGRPGSLIRVLIEIQNANRWLPKEVLLRVAAALDVPFSQVMQIASFYKTFRLKPKGRHEVHVCNGSSCHLRGAARVLETVERLTGIKPGETDAESRFSLETGNCLGSCSLGPEIIVDGTHHGRMTPDKVEDVLERYR
jgi:NADH-quinone oxidoreductase subunit E